MKTLNVLSLLLTVSVMVSISADNAMAQKVTKLDQSLRRGEHRNSLDPGLFREPRIREAYKVAKEIPWVLDSIYCYCYCEESQAFRHKSLLSCYVDTHAAE